MAIDSRRRNKKKLPAWEQKDRRVRGVLAEFMDGMGFSFRSY
jgi:hypothetical protein